MLRTQKIPREDLFGLFFVRKSYGTNWDSYYGTIDALRPLLESEDFSKTVSGFYLSYINDSTRISYFVSEGNNQKAISIFQNFFKEKGISEIKAQPPTKSVVAEEYGGEELEERFRHFLALETQIGLELIKEDLLYARILFVTYRFQVYKGWLPVRAHFEPTFLRYSPTYVSLSNEEKEQFLTYLERSPAWTHMMVNFVLGWDYTINRDGRPLSIPEINKILERYSLGFQIPLGWKPTP